MSKKKRLEWGWHGKCPICGKGFKTDACPHTYNEVDDAVKTYNNMVNVQKITKRLGK